MKQRPFSDDSVVAARSQGQHPPSGAVCRSPDPCRHGAPVFTAQSLAASAASLLASRPVLPSAYTEGLTYLLVSSYKRFLRELAWLKNLRQRSFVWEKLGSFSVSVVDPCVTSLLLVSFGSGSRTPGLSAGSCLFASMLPAVEEGLCWWLLSLSGFCASQCWHAASAALLPLWALGCELGSVPSSLVPCWNVERCVLLAWAASRCGDPGISARGTESWLRQGWWGDGCVGHHQTMAHSWGGVGYQPRRSGCWRCGQASCPGAGICVGHGGVCCFPSESIRNGHFGWPGGICR